MTRSLQGQSATVRLETCFGGGEGEGGGICSRTGRRPFKQTVYLDWDLNGSSSYRDFFL